ncbi:MAG: HAD family hydrolase [Clostridia bacterium]|nr:HAD family hydrolase [Clostridia bacterium]
MKKYQAVVFDADHTLLDYKADEISALKRLFLSLGLAVSGEALEWCHSLSERAWTEAGLYEVESERIQREYHALYKSHVTRIFEEFFEKYPCTVSPRRAGELFLEELCVGGNTLPFAEQTLASLSAKTGGAYRVCVATNGLERIQLGRLEGLKRYCEEIFISERLGSIKPTAAFFEKMLGLTGVAPNKCLMVGDSLASDILGGRKAGMDTCWLNTRGQENKTGVRPTYEIKNLAELTRLL